MSNIKKVLELLMESNEKGNFGIKNISSPSDKEINKQIFRVTFNNHAIAMIESYSAYSDKKSKNSRIVTSRKNVTRWCISAFFNEEGKRISTYKDGSYLKYSDYMRYPSKKDVFEEVKRIYERKDYIY